MTTDILITENLGGRWIDELKKKFAVTIEPDLWKSPDKIKALLPNCRALIVRNQTRVNADLLSAAVKLEVIGRAGAGLDRKSTRLNSSHRCISYFVFCLKT